MAVVPPVSDPSQSAPRASRRPSRRAYLLITVFALALVLLPFLFWHQTWFGRGLSEAEFDTKLADLSHPRQAQHALVQIGERIGRGDRSVRKWYPRIMELASSPVIELRQTVAWIMGQDSSFEGFREPLRKLLADPEPTVRRNAALALSNFKDEAARAELRTMLRPSTLVSPASGTLRYRLKEAEYVNPGTLVARVGEVEVRAKLPGEIRSRSKPDGATVAAGEPLAELSADREHAWEALRALYSIGNREDLADVQRFARGIPGMPERLQQQAVLTMRAIQNRAP